MGMGSTIRIELRLEFYVVRRILRNSFRAVIGSLARNQLCVQLR